MTTATAPSAELSGAELSAAVARVIAKIKARTIDPEALALIRAALDERGLRSKPEHPAGMGPGMERNNGMALRRSRTAFSATPEAPELSDLQARAAKVAESLAAPRDVQADYRRNLGWELAQELRASRSDDPDSLDMIGDLLEEHAQLREIGMTSLGARRFVELKLRERDRARGIVRE